MKKIFYEAFNKFAKNNGYADINSLLMDYGFMPTVLMPKHKKIEIINLFIKAIKNKGE